MIEAGRGCGQACAIGAEAAHPASNMIALIYGGGADRGGLIAGIARPVLGGRCDFVPAFGMGAQCGMRYSDVCAFHVIGRRMQRYEMGGDAYRIGVLAVLGIELEATVCDPLLALSLDLCDEIKDALDQVSGHKLAIPSN